MTTSIKSNALEPDPAELTGSVLSRIKAHLPTYGLVGLTVLLVAFFSFLLPTTFPTLFNLRAILSDKSVIALLALAAMVPMVTGKIDLTVGYGIVLWHILAITLQTQLGLSWPIAALIVLVCGALIGLINGMLVELAQIDSFIATLGTGTVLYAAALWHTGGRQVFGDLPESFYLIATSDWLGLPAPAFYVLAIAVVLWVVTEHMPLGRALYAIGANPKAAILNGIPLRRYIIGAFMTSGTITAFAGIVLSSRLRIGEASVGLEYLLPALVGAFLGSTTIRPGRVNVWGTLVGVAVLAVGISGIQQLGGAFFVEPLFNGATLLVSIGIAGYAQRRRTASIKKRIERSQRPSSVTAVAD